MRAFLIIHLLLLSELAFAETRLFETANLHPAIGDVGTLYLNPPGLYIHPMNNDFAGQTDKLMTGSFKTGLLRQWSSTSLQIETNWRMITPIFYRGFGEEELKIPIGRFADWGEAQAAYAYVLPLHHGKLKLELDLGFGDIGDKGGRELHMAIHRLLDSSLDNLTYTNQPSGKSGSGGYQMGYIAPEYTLGGLTQQNLYTTGAHYNKFMLEAFVQVNHITQFSKNLRLGLESSIIRQINSDVYWNEILPFRYEAAVGFYAGFYKPTLKWVSPYLQGDAHGQLYVDIINVHFEF